MGFESDVITDKQLYQIADAAAGDARLAIGMLRSAASTADRENHDKITNDILLDAAEDAQAQIKQKASIHSPHTSASSTISFATTDRSDQAKFTITIPRKSTIRGRSAPFGPTFLRWPSTTSSKRKARVATESTHSSIRQLRRRSRESIVRVGSGPFCSQILFDGVLHRCPC